MQNVLSLSLMVQSYGLRLKLATDRQTNRQTDTWYRTKTTRSMFSISENLRNECLFVWDGMNRTICLFRAPIHSPIKPVKRHSFLIFTMLQTKTLPKIIQEKLLIQNSRSDGHLNSFDALINVHVICRTTCTCWQWLSGIELKTRHVFVKHGCPRWQQSQIVAKISKSYILAPPRPQGYGMSVKCEPLNELTVQVWLLYHHSNFNYLTLFISGTELQTGGQTDRQTDRRTIRLLDAPGGPFRPGA